MSSIRAQISLTRSPNPRCAQVCKVICFDITTSSQNIASIFVPKSCPRITASISLFKIVLRQSRFDEPTVDHSPSTTAVLA